MHFQGFRAAAQTSSTSSSRGEGFPYEPEDHPHWDGWLHAVSLKASTTVLSISMADQPPKADLSVVRPWPRGLLWLCL